MRSQASFLDAFSGQCADRGQILGQTNGTIVYRLVTDVIQNSHAKQAVAFSPEISDALKALKAFNLERIYKKTDSTKVCKRHRFSH